MTRPAEIAGDNPVAHPAGDVGRGVPGGPIIVLTYAHAGDELLTRALSASQAVVCTRGTGLLPLCYSAVSTWQSLENRNAAPSQLALKSIRTLVNTMTAVIQSASGATRWCESAYVGRAAAQAFLQVIPEVTFLCMHRSLQAVLAEGIQAYPWGLYNSPFWTHAANHPGNVVATIAAYWAAHTEQLLDFESEHPEACLRVRHEDLSAEPQQRTIEIFTRLGLDTRDVHASTSHPTGDSDSEYAPLARPGPQPSLEQMFPPLDAKVRELHTRLGVH
jgi:Sulfotransferase family